jgi:hypothetical protein
MGCKQKSGTRISLGAALNVWIERRAGAGRFDLFGDFRNHASANRTATFADRKAQALFHRNRSNQFLNRHSIK